MDKIFAVLIERGAERIVTKLFATKELALESARKSIEKDFLLADFEEDFLPDLYYKDPQTEDVILIESVVTEDGYKCPKCGD